MKSVIVTGASGFLGKSVTHALLARSKNVFAVSRSHDISNKFNNIEFESRNLQVVKINSYTDVEEWKQKLENIDVVVHCAGLVHSHSNDLASFRKANVEATVLLASYAAKAGIKRFIFISSVSVYGNVSTKPFTEDDIASPSNSYSISKFEAERALIEIASKTAMEILIIRPPLIYGPNAPGNYNLMTKLIKSRLPIPLSGLRNKRSFVAVNNLVDFVCYCVDLEDLPYFSNPIFNVSDGDDISTTSFFSSVSNALGVSNLFFPFPISFIKCLATFFGKKSIFNSLFLDFQIDISKAKNLLGWSPSVSIDKQLSELINPSVNGIANE